MKVRKLTPSVLKKIIAEEKNKVAKKAESRKVNKKSLIESKIDEVTKLALREAKLLQMAKKLRKKRESIKSSVRKLSKK